MEPKKTGLTLIEILVVLGIIFLLTGILIPALNVVRNTARDAKQKAQFTTIELGLSAFKNDYGDYPPSNWTPQEFTGDYCGAQKLAEALLGWDLLGFHPNSAWRSDGLDAAGGVSAYDPAQTRDVDGDGVPDSLNERKGSYLELATSNAFRLGNISTLKPGLFDNTAPLEPDTFVICDVYGANKITHANGKTEKAGAPILYYKADASKKIIEEIYNCNDNDAIVQIKERADGGGSLHPLGWPNNNFQFFYDYIRDPKISARVWPYRPDSYILISAGADGLYGTNDDIRNFGN